MSSEEFRVGRRTGKYNRWAAELTDDQLEAVIWAVGEYGCRSSIPLEVLRQHSHFDPFSHARAVLALEVLADFTRGHFIDIDQYCAKVQEAVASAHEALRRSTAENARDARQEGHSAD
jgi:F420-dependent methylenetetrahydromethanopterin dehydrogenase